MLCNRLIKHIGHTKGVHDDFYTSPYKSNSDGTKIMKKLLTDLETGDFYKLRKRNVQINYGHGHDTSEEETEDSNDDYEPAAHTKCKYLWLGLG